jgi:hypothetical protein
MNRIEEPVRWLDPASGAPEELRRLLAAGQDAFGPKEGQLAELGSFVAGLGAAAGGSAAGAGGGAAGAHVAAHSLVKSAVLKFAVLAVVGSGATAGVWSAMREPHVEARNVAPVNMLSAAPRATTPAPVVVASAAQSAEPSDPVPLAPAVPPHEVSAPRRSLDTRPVEPPATSSPQSLAPPPAESELALLTRARGLVAANPADGLRALDEHKARFPHGVFEQEREVLAVEALLHLGRRDEARSRGAALAAVFPNSVHVRRVAVLLGESGQDK